MKMVNIHGKEGTGTVKWRMAVIDFWMMVDLGMWNGVCSRIRIKERACESLQRRG